MSLDNVLPMSLDNSVTYVPGWFKLDNAGYGVVLSTAHASCLGHFHAYHEINTVATTAVPKSRL